MSALVKERKMKSLLQQQPLFQLYRAWSTANPVFVRLGEGRFNITRREWRLLATLGSHQRLSVGDLAEAAQLDLSRTSKAVARLVEKGWVAKKKNKDNARSIWIQLEPEGQKLYEKLMPLVIEMNQILTQDLTSEELVVLQKALEKITHQAIQMNEMELVPEKARRGAKDSYG